MLENNLENVRPGDVVWYIDNGSDPPKERPAIVVSNVTACRVSRDLQIVPLSSSKKYEKSNLPTHFRFDLDRKRATALCEGVTSISRANLKPSNLWVNETVMAHIRERLKIAMDIR